MRSQSEQSHRQPRGRSAGFTLVELMMVLAILAILTTLAAPSFTTLMRTQRVRGATADLHSALQTARSSALTRSASITITPVGGDWKAGWAIHPTADASTVLQRGDAFTGLAITANPAGAITYKRDGRASGAIKIDITDPDGTVKRCVKVDSSGRAMTAEGGCA